MCESMQPWDLAQSYRFSAQNHGSVSIHWKAVPNTAEAQLARIDWSWKRYRPDPSLEAQVLIPEAICRLIVRIEDYFLNGLAIGEVPWNLLDQSGWSEFQRSVFQSIAQIPHGETRTYGWVAARIGKSQASRAVGQALKCNPFPILVPCHRVVSTQSLGGFMGTNDPDHPEVALKRSLIRHEESYRNPVFSFLRQSPAFFLTESAQFAAIAGVT